jgi:hypothetical protein
MRHGTWNKYASALTIPMVFYYVLHDIVLHFFILGKKKALTKKVSLVSAFICIGWQEKSQILKEQSSVIRFPVWKDGCRVDSDQ